MPLPIAGASPQRTIKTILAVAAGKGGVGKSTVSVNLALALQERGFSVGILDTDIYGPSVRKMLPEIKMPVQQGDSFSPAECYGIKVMSMAFFRKEGQAAAVRAPIVNGILQQFIHKVQWGALDFLIVDFPPGTGDIQLTLAQQAKITAALLVTTPQEVALQDVRKAAALFMQVGIPLLGVVENMSYYLPSPGSAPVYLFGKEGGKKLAEEASIPLLGEIPVDPAVSLRGDRGFSLFLDDGNGLPPAAEAFRQLAAKVLEELPLLGTKVSKRRMVELQQIDRFEFVITWDDGISHRYRLSNLQKNCPCAGCSETPAEVDLNVCARKVEGVGQYALRFDFTSGCSYGIYSFDQLYELGQKK